MNAGIDQYLAILHPLEYSTKMTARLGGQLMAATWIFGMLGACVGAMEFINGASPWRSCQAAISDNST